MASRLGWVFLWPQDRKAADWLQKHFAEVRDGFSRTHRMRELEASRDHAHEVALESTASENPPAGTWWSPVRGWVRGRWSHPHTKTTIQDMEETLRSLRAPKGSVLVAGSPTFHQGVGLQGLVLNARVAHSPDVTEYRIGVTSTDSMVNESLILENLIAIRRRYPYALLLTNDTPDLADEKSHLDVASAQLDATFVNEFPHKVLHLDYPGFVRGPEVYSRLFDIGLGDLTYVWEGIVGNAIPPVTYVLFLGARRVSLDSFVERVADAPTDREFEERALGVVDLILSFFEGIGGTLLTGTPALRDELDETLPRYAEEESKDSHGTGDNA